MIPKEKILKRRDDQAKSCVRKYTDAFHNLNSFITKFEKTRILGTRAEMLAHGSEPMINVPSYCTDVLDTDECRKPNTGMAILAKNAFPEIDFTKSIIVGDSSVDIEFGRKLGFTTVFINSSNKEVNYKSDFKFNSLHEFAQYLNTN